MLEKAQVLSLKKVQNKGKREDVLHHKRPLTAKKMFMEKLDSLRKQFHKLTESHFPKSHQTRRFQGQRAILLWD